MTAQIRESLVWPVRQINSISLGSVCFWSLETSTNDDKVLMGDTTGGIDDLGGDEVDAPPTFGVTIFGGGRAIFFFRISIFG